MYMHYTHQLTDTSNVETCTIPAALITTQFTDYRLNVDLSQHVGVPISETLDYLSIE